MTARRSCHAFNGFLSMLLSFVLVFSMFPSEAIAQGRDEIQAALGAAPGGDAERAAADSAREVAVTFVPNELEGEDAEAQATARAGSQDALAVPSPAFSQENYRQTGWNTAADASGTQLPADPSQADAAQAAAGADAVSLYATWEARDITVRYYGNGATSGKMDAQAFAYDEETALSANAFKRDGYRFTGWSTTPDGESIADDPATPDVDESYHASFITGDARLLKDVATCDADDDGAAETFDLAYAVGADVEPAAKADKDAKKKLEKENARKAKRDGSDPADSEKRTITLFAQWEKVPATKTAAQGSAAPAPDEGAASGQAGGSAGESDSGASDADAAEAGSADSDGQAAAKPATRFANGAADVRDADEGGADELAATVVKRGMVARLFSGMAKAPAAHPGDNPESDGCSISGVTFEWLPNPNGGTRDSMADGVLTVKPAAHDGHSANEKQSVRAQLTVDLAGEHDYETGDISIVIPGHIFQKRADEHGNRSAAGNLVLPLVENPGNRTEFNWSYDAVADEYTLTSTHGIAANASIEIKMDIENIMPSDLVDCELSKPLYAKVYATNYQGNVLTRTSDGIKARFDTQESLQAGSAKVEYTAPGWQSGVSADRIRSSYDADFQDQAGVTSYLVVTYFTHASVTGDANFTLAWAAETADAYGGTVLKESATVVDDGWIPNGTSPYQYIRVAYPYEITSEFTGSNADGAAPTFDADGKGYYFAKDVGYNLTAKVTWTCTQSDPADAQEGAVHATTQEALGTVPYKRTDPAQKPTEDYWPGDDYQAISWGDDNDGSYTTHGSPNAGGEENTDLRTKVPNASTSRYGVYPVALVDLSGENGEAKPVDVRFQKAIWGRSIPGYGEKDAEKTVHLVYESGGYKLGDQVLTPGVDYDLTSISVYEPLAVKSANFGRGTFTIDVTERSKFPQTVVEYSAVGGSDEEVWDDPAAGWTAAETIDWSKVGQRSAPRPHVDVKFGGTCAAPVEGQIPSDAARWRIRIDLTGNESTQVEDEYVLANVTVKPSALVKKAAQDALRTSGSPQLALTVADAYAAEDDRDAGPRIFVHENRTGTVYLQGYNDRLRASLTSGLTVGSWDNPPTRVALQFSGEAHERSSMATAGAYQEAVAKGVIAPETSGTWYDLLPAGVSADLSTVRLRPGDAVNEAYVIDDYKHTGRQLLVVKASLTPVPRADGNDDGNIQDAPAISFTGYYSLQNYQDLGGADLHHVLAFQSGNDALGNVEGAIGEADDPSGTNNATTAEAFADDGERAAMKGLDPDNGGKSTFVYAGNLEGVPEPLNYAVTGLAKSVDAEGDGVFSPGTKTDSPQIATEGADYTYRISYSLGNEESSSEVGQKANGVVLFDRLENPLADDKLSAADRANSWKGLLLGVDLAELEAEGVAPQLYYSTKVNLDLGDFGKSGKSALGADMDVTDAATWTPVTATALRALPADTRRSITAIAIDCGTAADGGSYHLEFGTTLSARIQMLAPSGEAGEEYYDAGAHAYNNAAVKFTLGEAEMEALRSAYTEVGLRPYDVRVTNAWVDESNRDGVRPDEVKVQLVALDSDGEEVAEYSREVAAEDAPQLAEQVGLADNEKTEPVIFEDVAQMTEDGVQLHYTARALKSDGTAVSAAAEGHATGYAQTSRASAGKDDAGDPVYSIDLLNKHVPEKTSVAVTKQWEGDDAVEDTARPSAIRLQLYGGTGESKSLVATHDVRPNDGGAWGYTFEDLYKYESGLPMAYSVAEKAAGDDRANDYVAGEATEADGAYTIVNTYHPYGDLIISKEVVGGTSVTANREFTFTVRWQGTNEGAPARYTLSDDDAKDAHELVNGGTIALKAGQSATIDDLPKDTAYSVIEDVPEGYTADEQEISGIIHSNATATAAFRNVYSTRGNASLQATKTLSGQGQHFGQFTFELRLKDDASLQRVASNQPTADGNATVGFGALHYSGSDSGKTYTYTIAERDLGNAGYTYDATGYEADVTPTDNGDGTMTCDVTYYKVEGDTRTALEEGAVPAFANKYRATGDLTLTAYKRLVGDTLADGEFSFDLYGQDGKVKSVVNKDGMASFPLSFTQDGDNDIAGKTLVYYAVENPSDSAYGSEEGDAKSKDNVQFDANAKAWAVQVQDEHNGKLSFTTTVLDAHKVLKRATSGAWELADAWRNPDDITSAMVEEARTEETPVFTNTLAPGALSIEKTVAGDVPEDNADTFAYDVEVTDKEGNAIDGDVHYKLEDAAGNDITGTAADHNVVADEGGAAASADAQNGAASAGDSAAAAGAAASDSAAANPLAQAAGFVASLFAPQKAYAEEAADTYTVTYEANGGTFKSGATTNAVTYRMQHVNEPKTVYSHTANIDDEGNAYGTYASNLSTNDVVTIPGATKLTIDVWCSTESTSYDWLAIYPAGITPSSGNYRESISGKLGGNSRKTKNERDHKTFTVDGDTAQFYFKSDSSSNYYGYYAVITANEYDTGVPMSGSYEEPEAQGKSFTGWYEDADAKTAVADPTAIGKDATVYAKMENDIALGTSGTVSWKIDSKGVLKFYPTIGDEGTFANGTYTTIRYEDKDSLWPWSKFGSQVRKVESQGTIHGSKNMAGMFAYFQNMGVCDVANWDMSGTENANYMFYSCSALSNLDVANWDVGNLADADYMFSSCKGLASLDVSRWDVHSLQSASAMFSSNNFTALDLSNWDTGNLVNAQHMFADGRKLVSLDLSNWDAKNISNTREMFRNCTGLKAFDFLQIWNVQSLENAEGMFSGCENMTSLDLSAWRTPSLTNMASMFNDCKSLKSLDVSKFDTSKVTSFQEFFHNCSALESLDLSDWNTGSMTNGRRIFMGCGALKKLDLRNWDTSNLKNANQFFEGLSGVEELYLTNWDLSRATNMEHMFDGCSKLHTLDISHWKTADVQSMSYMFHNCRALDDVSFPELETPTLQNLSGLFSGCSSLTSFDLSGLDTSNITSMASMFRECTSLTALDISDIDAPETLSTSGMFWGCSKLKSVKLPRFGMAKLRNTSEMFSKCTALENLAITGVDTSAVTDMNSMFQDCASLRELDIAEMDTSAASNLNSMFRRCSALKSVDVSHMDTSKATSMGQMFSGCTSLESLDTSGWNTRNCSYMVEMFLDCKSLKQANLPNLVNSKVPNLQKMFSGCSSLESLDLSTWDTSGVTSMVSMFQNCASLQSVDVSNWNTSKCEDMESMFYGCTSLKSLDLSSFDTAKLRYANNLLTGDNNLASIDISGFNTAHLYDSYSLNLVWDGQTLKRITVGDTAAQGTADYAKLKGIPRPTGDECTGYWINEADPSVSYAANAADATDEHPNLLALLQQKGAYTPGTYVWQLKDVTWNVAYDPNADDATGSMSPSRSQGSSVQAKAPGFVRNGYSFTGWNTAADGSGTAYAAGDAVLYDDVKASLAGDDKAITLYAQWQEDPKREATNGHFSIVLEAGQKLTITDLPAGATYRVTEHDQPVWELTSASGTTGIIPTAATAAARFTNTYDSAKVSVSAVITAQKLLDGTTANTGGYSFALKDDQGQTVTVDGAEQVKASGDGGAVAFDPISYDAPGEYKYTISEVAGTAEGIDYDDHAEDVTVTVTRDAQERLSAMVSYANERGAVFRNATAASDPASLTVAKTVNGTDATDKEFTFEVTLMNNGAGLDGTFGGVTVSGGTATVKVKAGESTTLDGLPANTAYDVVEKDIPTGYTLASSQNASGMLKAGDAQTATFENDYAATGTATLAAKKTIEGRTLDDGEFWFKLVDAKGKVVVAGSQEMHVTNTADGSITFAGMPYTMADVGEHRYWLVEDAQTDHDDSVVYDDAVYEYVVNVADDGAGGIGTTAQAYRVGAIGEEHAADAEAVADATPVFKNTLKELEMPFTGLGGVAWTWIAGAGALAAVLLYLLRIRRQPSHGRHAKGGDVR